MTTTEIIDIDGPVHIADHGGTGDLLVFVHGLEGSHLNWMGVAPAFAERYRVVAPDLSGFGLTPPARRGSTVDTNAQLVLDVVRRYGGGPATLIGNSMGGLVSMLAAVAEPSLVARLVLVDPAMPPPTIVRADPETVLKLAGPMLPVVGPQLLRLYRTTRTPEEHAAENLAFIAAHPELVDPVHNAASVEMARLRRQMEWSEKAFVDAARSIGAHVLNRRGFRRLVHQVCQPTLLVHGTEDRLVPLQAAKWVTGERPDWDVRIWDDTGHVPMIEDPGRFTAEVLDWLALETPATRRR